MTHHNRLTQPTRYRDEPGSRLRWEARLLQAVGWVILAPLVVVGLVVFVVVSVPRFLKYGLSRVLESVLAAWGWL